MSRTLVALLLLLAFGAKPVAADPVVFTPHAGARLPLGAMLRDERDRPLRLGAFFDGKPVVLVLEYLGCRTLCGLELEHAIAALDPAPLTAGRDFQFVAISIDPRDTPTEAAAAKTKYLALYHHPEAERGFHFLTGPEAVVRPIAEAVGFSYRYDPVLDQYTHPAGLVIAAPGGTISRYLLGVAPETAELKTALADAAAGRSTDPLTRFLLFCHGVGLPVGRYTVPVEAAFMLANVAGLAVLLVIFTRIHRRHR